MGENPSFHESWLKSTGKYPVENVSWGDCQEFIKKLNVQSGRKFRLPTEAEWEYAARSGGRDERYAGGSDIYRVAWYAGNSGDSTHAVGSKAPNGLGLFDMSGNVGEWCADWYGMYYYRSSSERNPRGPDTGSARIYRGGCSNSIPGSVRSAFRGRSRPGGRDFYLGFRLASPGR